MEEEEPGRELVLRREQELVLPQERERERELEPVLALGRWPRHNRGLRSLESSWRRASKVRWYRFSKLVRRSRCASYQWFVRQLQM